MPELACATEIGTIQIDVTTLDSWLVEAGDGPVDFIKLDVQGAELDVLKGGEECLQQVRGLEIEVEFNPIYYGQPLFGDVDRFLRRCGFVLWRLSNLVHYTDGRDKVTLPATDKFHYDSQPVVVQGLAGQLFWGHAYYVRPEIAAGGAELDWRQCLRDAAVWHVLGFYDLSNRLLRSASLNGPTELAELLSDRKYATDRKVHKDEVSAERDKK